ncbi:hypothetical protein D9758_013930 [Tetrapyrgos nigripes]|uniref:Uncharacterized protein n=1 Tax=Tetrapyrgos nigripes TaxID=182062 RepID=A0A8H5CGT2_9AGAR|nr:hypothetical protein D9758_013930 [Tetrapyrgos nigripes]
MPSSFLTTPDIAGIQLSLRQHAIEGMVFGIELLLTLFTILLLCQQGLRQSLMRTFLVAASGTMLINSAITVALDLVGDIIQVHALLDPTYDPTSMYFNTEVVTVVLARLSYFLGDLIVVWRAWMIFKGEIVPRAILLFCIIQSFACSIYNAVLATKKLLGFILVDTNPARIILPVSLLFTNITATLLIGYKAWQYRQSVKIHLSNLNTTSQVEQIFVLLIQSGILYCILWVLTLPYSFVPAYLHSVAVYLDVIIPHIEAIFPTAIILLSYLYKSQDTILSAISVSEEMEFAVPAPTSQSALSASTHPHDTQHVTDKESSDIQEVHRGDSTIV